MFYFGVGVPAQFVCLAADSSQSSQKSTSRTTSPFLNNFLFADNSRVGHSQVHTIRDANAPNHSDTFPEASCP